MREKKALVLHKTGVLCCTFALRLFLWGAPEKPFRFKEKNVAPNIGVVVGVVVLLLCLGFVVLMMVSEWSKSAPMAPASLAASVPKKKAAKKAAKKARPAPTKKAARKSKKN